MKVIYSYEKKNLKKLRRNNEADCTKCAFAEKTPDIEGGYRPYSGMQWEGLIGQDPGYVASELQRRITDALTMDDRVRGIPNFSYTVEGDKLSASLTVNTVFGEMDTSVEVNLQ